MKRILLGLLGLMISAAVVAAFMGRSVSPGPTYTVAQVQKALAQHRATWVGRTIVVRGAIIAAYYGPTSAGYDCGRGLYACPINVVDIPPSDSAHVLLAPSTGHGNRGAIPGGIAIEGSGSNAASMLTLTYISPAGDVIPTILLRVQPQVQSQAAHGLVTLLRKISFLRMLLPQDTQHRYPALGVYRVRILDRPTCSHAANVGIVCDDAVLQAGVAS